MGNLMIKREFLPAPPTEIRLDLAILKADHDVKLTTAQMFMTEIPHLTEFCASVIVESMLPHKKILQDRLCDLDTQFRMEYYGH